MLSSLFLFFIFPWQMLFQLKWVTYVWLARHICRYIILACMVVEFCLFYTRLVYWQYNHLVMNWAGSRLNNCLFSTCGPENDNSYTQTLEARMLSNTLHAFPYCLTLYPQYHIHPYKIALWLRNFIVYSSPFLGREVIYIYILNLIRIFERSKSCCGPIWKVTALDIFST